MTTPHQDSQVAAVLDWPPIGSNPIEEFRTPGYITQAFPALFPTGNADLSNPRESKISPTEYFKHLMLFHDHRFANDPRFRLVVKQFLDFELFFLIIVFNQNNQVNHATISKPQKI